MGVSRRLRKRCVAVLAIFVAAMGMAFGFSAPVGAADEASGSAFGLFAQGLIDIDPEPEAAFPPGGQDTTIEIDLGGLLLACTLNASSQGFDGAGNEVDNVADAESVESSASVESAVLLGNPDADCENGDTGSGGGDLFDFLDDLLDDILGGTGLPITAIASECTADENGARGSSTLVGLGGDDPILGDLLGGGLDLNDLALDLGLDLDLDLGILQLVLDEQIEDPDGDGITVRALRLTLLPGTGGDEPLQEVILAESQCRLVADDGPTSTSTTRPPTSTTRPPVPDDNDADNDSDISNDSDGTAVIDTGDASAVGNISDTEINQTADATGGNVNQDAAVVNEGTADANTGDNTAIGNNSINVVENRQSAVASSLDSTTTGTIPGHNSASNTSTASNTSNGTAAIETGDADAVGNISNTEVNQTAHATGGTSGFFGGGVDQDAAVVNSGDASANTGGNTAIGNNSENVVSNDQTAVAVGDDDAVNPCCNAPDGANTASNTSAASNTSDGTAAISTGDADAVGNVSETAIDQNATVTGGSVPCGGTCQPEPCGGTCEPEPCGECPDPCPDPEPECPGQCPDPDPEPECPGQCPGDDDPCEPRPCGGTCGNPWTHGFGWSSVSQSASVTNSGSASANTGGNTAIGNNSVNVATNEQTAVAADDD